jgi:hypothetical protein
MAAVANDLGYLVKSVTIYHIQLVSELGEFVADRWLLSSHRDEDAVTIFSWDE